MIKNSLEFLASYFYFWMRHSIRLDDDSLYVTEQNAVLGALPLFEKRRRIPLRSVEEVSLSREFSLAALLAGAGLAFAGAKTVAAYPGQDAAFFGFVLLALGVNALLSRVFSLRLFVRHSEGEFELSAPLSERGKLVRAERMISESLNGKGTPRHISAGESGLKAAA